MPSSMCVRHFAFVALLLAGCPGRVVFAPDDAGEPEAPCVLAGLEECSGSSDCEFPRFCGAHASSGSGCCVLAQCEVMQTCEVSPQACEPGVLGTHPCASVEECVVAGSEEGQCTTADALIASVVRCEVVPALVVSRPGALAPEGVAAFDANGSLVPYPLRLYPSASSTLLVDDPGLGGRVVGPCNEGAVCVAPIEIAIRDVTCDGLLLVLAGDGTNVVVRSGDGPAAGASVTFLLSDQTTETVAADKYGLAVSADPVVAVAVEMPGFRREIRALSRMRDVVIDLRPLAPVLEEVAITPEAPQSAQWIALAGSVRSRLFDMELATLFGTPVTLSPLANNVSDLVLPSNFSHTYGAWTAKRTVLLERGVPRWAIASSPLSLLQSDIDLLTSSPTAAATLVLSRVAFGGFDGSGTRSELRPTTRLSAETPELVVPPAPCLDEACGTTIAVLTLVNVPHGFAVTGVAMLNGDDHRPELSLRAVESVLHDGLEGQGEHHLAVAFADGLARQSAIFDEALPAFPLDPVDTALHSCAACDVIVEDDAETSVWLTPENGAAVDALLAELGIRLDVHRATALYLSSDPTALVDPSLELQVDGWMTTLF